MSFAQKIVVNVTTDASGDATAYSIQCSGRLNRIRYAKTDFADGVDFTITIDESGETVWSQLNVNAGVTVSPRLAVVTTAGVAAYYDSIQTTSVRDRITIAQQRFKVVIANGGDTKTGSFEFYLE